MIDRRSVASTFGFGGVVGRSPAVRWVLGGGAVLVVGVAAAVATSSASARALRPGSTPSAPSSARTPVIVGAGPNWAPLVAPVRVSPADIGMSARGRATGRIAAPTGTEGSRRSFALVLSPQATSLEPAFMASDVASPGHARPVGGVAASAVALGGGIGSAALMASRPAARQSAWSALSPRVSRAEGAGSAPTAAAEPAATPASEPAPPAPVAPAPAPSAAAPSVSSAPASVPTAPAPSASSPVPPVVSAPAAAPSTPARPSASAAVAPAPIASARAGSAPAAAAPSGASPGAAPAAPTASRGGRAPAPTPFAGPSAAAAPAPPSVTPPTGRSVGLGPEARAIDLTAPGLANGALLTDELRAAQGLALEGAAYFGSSAGGGAFNAFTALYDTPALQNGVSAAPTDALTMHFARPVRAVGFNLFAVQFEPSFVASGLATGPSFTVRYESGDVLRFDDVEVQDPTLYRLLPAAQRPDPLWWVFEQGGLISSLTVHAPMFFASQLGLGFSDVIGDLYLANVQVIDAVEPDVQPPTKVPEPAALGLVALGLAALALRRRR